MQFDTKIAVVLRDDLAVWKDQRDGLGASTDSLLRGLNVQAVTDRAVENIQQLGTAHLDDHAWHACSWCPARPRGHRGASRVACMQALTSTYRDDAGHIGQEILYREAHSRLEVEEEGRALELRRRREAVPPRIRGAADPHRALFDPYLAVTRRTSTLCRARSEPSTGDAVRSLDAVRVEVELPDDDDAGARARLREGRGVDAAR
jgi:hypothetical protein